MGGERTRSAISTCVLPCVPEKEIVQLASKDIVQGVIAARSVGKNHGYCGATGTVWLIGVASVVCLCAQGAVSEGL